MVTRNSKSGKQLPRSGPQTRTVLGAHASRAVTTASGDEPVGVEALGRFDAMLVLVRSGNVRPKPSCADVDACAPRMPGMSVLDVVASERKPAATVVTGLNAGSGSRRTAGLASREPGPGIWLGLKRGWMLDRTNAWFVRQAGGLDCRVGNHGILRRELD